MYRKGSYIVGRIAGLIAVLLLGSLVAVQTPFVQTKLTQKALEHLVPAMQGRIGYDELRILPSGVLLLKNAVIVDSNPYTEDIHGRGWEKVDTLFRARTITATFRLASIFGGGSVLIDRVDVSDAMMHLAVEPGEVTNLERIFGLEQTDETPEPGPEIFSIRKVRISNFRFRLNNFCEATAEWPGYGINYDDIDLTTDMNGHSLRFAGGRMYGVADKVTLTEKSGYRLLRASGRCVAGQGKTLVENFRLTDPWSQLNVKSFSMTYENSASFEDFITKVLMECELRPSMIGIPTLKYLAGILDGVDSELEVYGGRFRGYVNDFSLSEFDFKDKESGISGRIGGNAIGLPDTERMLASLRIEGLKFNTSSLSGVLAEWLPYAGIPDLSQYAPGIGFSLDAKVSGPVDRLAVEASLKSSAGILALNADVRNLASPERGVMITGGVGTSELGLDRIVPGLPFGNCSLEARAAAMLDGESGRIRLDTLDIGSISYKGIEYSGISASGSFIGNTLNCLVESSDPSLELSLQALATLGSRDSVSRYAASGTIGNIDLHKLGIDPREGISRISMDLDADLSTVGGVLEGHAALNGVKVENNGGRMEIGDISFLAFDGNGEQNFSLRAPFADLSFTGGGDIEGFLADMRALTLDRHLPAISPESADSSRTGHREYRLEAVFHDSREVLSFTMPGLYIADSTRFALSLSVDGMMDASLRSPRLAFGRNYVRGVEMVFGSTEPSMELKLSGSEMRAGNIMVERPEFSADARKNSFGAALSFDGFAGGGKDGRLLMQGGVARDSSGVLTINAHPLDSYLATSDGIWVFDESDIIYDGKNVRIDGFRLSKGRQLISIDGAWSRDETDTLSAEARDIDLAIIDEFLPEKLGIRGKAHGKVLLTSGNGPLPGMLVNIRLDSLGIGGADAGSIRLASSIAEESSRLRLILRHTVKDREALTADGSYNLKNGDASLKARLDSLPLTTASPFLREIFDDFGGAVSGNISVVRDSSGFAVSGDALHVDDVSLGLAYTGVNYHISGPLGLDNTGLHFDNIIIRDGADGIASLSGTIRHSQLKDFELDSRLSLDNIKVVDASEGGSSGIYGLLRVSGTANVSGPFSALGINAAVRTSGIGNIHIPASESVSGTTTNLLSFTEPPKPVDPYDEMLSDYTSASAGGGDIDIQARLTAHPGVTAYIELDKSAGSIASFSGEGSVSVHLRPSSSIFDINGDYNISEGSYTFSIPGILNRDFEIQEGSSVKFSGNIPDTELDIDAVYRLKTSLSSLIADNGGSSDDADNESSAGATREVECGINISDRVRNPRLSFSINVPDLNPTVKSQVESALNTDDKVQKQFMALLLLGSFIPDESSGVVNGSDILLSNVTELMSNQLNSILQKLDIPLDVGIGYQGTNGGTNVFDVAISTQLFNNRVIVGGNVGNRRYGSTAGTNGDVVGDLDIQIKLDPEGKFRLNLFSHSADEYSNYLDYSQRNGVGISYQREYARLGDLLGSIFGTRRKKEEQNDNDDGQTRMTVIRIEDEQGETISDTDSAGRQ